MRKTRGIKRTFEIGRDVVDVLDRWSARTGIAKGVAVELGVWVVTHLSSLGREGLLELMRSGFGPTEEQDGSDFLSVHLYDSASQSMRQQWETLLAGPIRDDLPTQPHAGASPRGENLGDRLDHDRAPKKRKSG